jgi:hypothetical protein
MLQLKQEFGLDCQQQEMIVSSMLFGALLASLTGGWSFTIIVSDSVLCYTLTLLVAIHPNVPYFTTLLCQMPDYFTRQGESTECRSNGLN